MPTTASPHIPAGTSVVPASFAAPITVRAARVPAGTSGLGPDDQPLPCPLHPRHVLRQQHGGRAHAIALGLAPGRRGPTFAQRPCGVEQTLAHADDADVGAPETLERSIVGGLTLRDRLVLRADARHAEELRRALGLPVR